MNKYTTTVLLASIGIASSVQANDLNINGFLSVGASMLDDNTVTVAGTDNQGGFKQDTVLGLQIQKQVNETTSATGQLVSRGSEDYSTESAWAFVTYAATDSLDLRMGRLRIPFFYFSDFLEVGYAYNMIRPPAEVYSIAFSSIDGVDLTKSFSSGDFDGSAQIYYGRFSGEVGPANTFIDARNFVGIALNGNLNNFGGRLSYHQTDLKVPALPAIPNKDFAASGQTATFVEAALSYDDGVNSIITEVTQLTYGTAAFLDESAWLISAARRFSDLTLHATYSTRSTEFDSGTNGDIQKLAGLELEESSATLGLRYDYDSSTALKLEVQNIDEKTIAGADGKSANLYSVAVDVVF